ncbi:NAD(+)/NADH kinase [Belliella sp. DSM 107340]|uniref:NAD(+)/NADH kinase n=1 Tax=Belliella calami TaxID=2923436 RepID=A0ABS9UNL2_9BACT|nr:diacylglycerol kinase family protein [Belliella calami]MCH7398010.1 NAD(+)/NADH kinase [Belliella calami]
MQKQALLIVNPASGNLDNKTELIEEISKNTTDYSITEWNTTGEGDDQKILQLLENGTYDLIMVAGGDGTIKLVGSQMEGINIPLLPIPFGSANGLCSCLGIETWEDSIRALYGGSIINMDVLDVNGDICLHVCDFGFNAGLIKKFEESDERGMGSYFKSSLAQAFENNKYKFNIHVNGERKTISAKMLVIANGDRYGTGVKINPNGKMDDGKFEIVVLNPDSLKEWIALSIAFMKEDLSDLGFVQTYTTEKITIENLNNASCHVDGEIKEDKKNITIKMNGTKIKFHSNL